MNRIFIISIVLFTFIGCSKETIYLRNDGADMPIAVKGNISSGVFVLFLHGGPGASGFYDKFGSFFSEIEKSYAMIYWEQRASGLSQGKTQSGTITIPQYIDDIDKVIVLIRKLYNNPTIILMGHSWGGGLGTAYLINKSNSNFNNIKAWIEIDGLHNAPLSFTSSKNKIIDYANGKIIQGTETDYWTNCINWYNSISNSDLLKYPNTDTHSKYVDKMGGYWYGTKYNYASLSNIFFSASSGFDFLSNKGYVHEQSLESFLVPFTSNMNKITIPTLILWGKHDGCIPVDLAQNAYDSIGTINTNKSIYIFENSAHSPYIEEKDIFNNIVTNFITTYK